MDQALGFMREARAALLEERDNGGNSRELSVALTEIDTAILWRQHDLQMKRPPDDRVGVSEEYLLKVQIELDNLEITQLKEAYENMRDFAIKSGLDVTCYGPL